MKKLLELLNLELMQQDGDDTAEETAAEGTAPAGIEEIEEEETEEDMPASE